MSGPLPVHIPCMSRISARWLALSQPGGLGSPAGLHQAGAAKALALAVVEAGAPVGVPHQGAVGRQHARAGRRHCAQHRAPFMSTQVTIYAVRDKLSECERTCRNTCAAHCLRNACVCQGRAGTAMAMCIEGVPREAFSARARQPDSSSLAMGLALAGTGFSRSCGPFTVSWASSRSSGPGAPSGCPASRCSEEMLRSMTRRSSWASGTPMSGSSNVFSSYILH